MDYRERITHLERPGWPDFVFAFHDRDEGFPPRLHDAGKFGEDDIYVCERTA